MNNPLKSQCCDAPLEIWGRKTHYYVCKECGEPSDPKPETKNCMTMSYDECNEDRARLQRELDAVLGSHTLSMAAKVARARQREIEDLTAELSGVKACLQLTLDAMVVGAERLKNWQNCAENLRTCLSGTYTGGEYWRRREEAIEQFELLKGPK